MSADERLYHLLPAIHRRRDADQGEVLRALLAVIEAEHDLVHDDIAALYDDWFVETCAEWVVPYIGDLLGVRPLRAPGRAGAFTLRPYVANTLAYRRRKGTAAMLEQLARDVTNWPARAVEFFQLLGWNQNVNHLRPACTGCPDLRRMDALELVGGPFEQASHTVDVRRIAGERGRYNIPNVGLFLWRLQDYSMVQSMAAAAADPPDGRYSFSPLGNSAPLFNRPRTQPRFARVAAESSVPAPLRRWRLHEELEARRQAVADGATPPAAAAASAVYFGEPPVLRVVADGAEIPPLRIVICNLEAWRLPPASKPYTPANGGPKVPMPIGVAVDPVLGRIAFPAGVVPASVVVDYVYGFSADLGGGPYDRRRPPPPAGQPAAADPDTVADPAAYGALFSVSATAIPTISQALAAWKSAAPPQAVIQVEDSRTYREDLTIAIGGADRLVLQAANLQRPALIGSVTVTAAGGTGAERLALNGLLIGGGAFSGGVVEGDVTINGALAELEISHCTVVPGRRLDADGVPQEPDQPSLTVAGTAGPNDRLQVVVDHSILGPLRLPATLAGVTVRDSILDGGPLHTIAGDPSGAPVRQPTIAADGSGAPGPPASIERTTSLGPVHVTDLVLASEAIFDGVVTSDRRQDGCARFSYVPDGSATPRRYECQPDLALARRKQELGLGPADALPPAERAAVLARVRPELTATRYGSPAYAQLSLACAAEIRTGAEDGSEMGAFGSLQQPQREANLRAGLEEYLRFGLEAGIFYVT